MNNFIDEYLPYIIAALSFLLNFLNMVYTRRKTSTSSKIIDTEVSTMKYRTANYREKAQPYKQSFSSLVKTYRLDKSTGELVESDVIDVDKLVKSNIESSFEKMFERFMPVDVTDKIKQDVDQAELDLSDVGAAMDILCDWREKLGLDDLTPAEDVLSAIEKYRNDSLEKLKAVNQVQEVKKELENEKEKTE